MKYARQVVKSDLLELVGLVKTWETYEGGISVGGLKNLIAQGDHVAIAIRTTTGRCHYILLTIAWSGFTKHYGETASFCFGGCLGCTRQLSVAISHDHPDADEGDSALHHKDSNFDAHSLCDELSFRNELAIRLRVCFSVGFQLYYGVR